MISAHNKRAMVCMIARDTQKTTFSCAHKQNISLKPPFFVHVSLINKKKAYTLIDLVLVLREAEQ
ncbi:hypothetical protein [Methyloglobulus sp.]|uniref:hypothetical protein n=1 Tax=Methyloglobulus sp. TaxID=2518622 RepID=UPI0032B864BF